MNEAAGGGGTTGTPATAGSFKTGRIAKGKATLGAIFGAGTFGAGVGGGGGGGGETGAGAGAGEGGGAAGAAAVSEAAWVK